MSAGRLLPLLALWSLSCEGLWGGLTRPDAEYCATDGDCAARDKACDRDRRVCVPRCTSDAQCGDERAPLCVGQRCVACTGTNERRCGDRYPGRAVCLPDGGCAACARDEDCGADGAQRCAEHQCTRACQRHADCSISQLCDVICKMEAPGCGEYQGTCRARGDVFYVPRDGTLEMALRSGREVVRVEQPQTVDAPLRVDRPLRVYGDAEPCLSTLTCASGSRLLAGAAPDYLFELAGGGSLVLDGLDIEGAPGRPAGGVSCDPGDRLELRRSKLADLQGTAVSTGNCGEVLIDRALVRNSRGGALRLVVDKRVRVTSSVFVGNDNDFGKPAVQLVGGSGTLTFAFNTLVRNHSSLGGVETAGALRCEQALRVTDSIITRNSVDAGGKQHVQCELLRTARGDIQDEPTDLVDTPKPFTLPEGSGCCLEKGLYGEALLDLHGSRRKARPDIGATQRP